MSLCLFHWVTEEFRDKTMVRAVEASWVGCLGRFVKGYCKVRRTMEGLGLHFHCPIALDFTAMLLHLL
jgi:hypothetical protein